MPTEIKKTPVPAAITTPSSVETGIGTLEFTDGYPTAETAEKLRDHLDYLHGVETFMNTIQGVSVYAIRQGFHDAGVADGDVLICSGLMDSRSLFLTANADTVYFWSFHDLSQGPLVFETPSDTLGLFNDIWFRWISDFGLPGADRGQGGTYLLVGPDYDGPLPEGGYYVRHSRTNHVTLIGRAFINENPGMDPAPTADRIKEQLKIYPYVAGGLGSSVGAYLTGKGPLGQPASSAEPPVRGGDGSGDEHRPAQRLRPLRDARRLGADGAGRGARHRAGRTVRRHRDRQGREVRARRPAAEDPRRRGGRRQRRLPDRSGWVRPRPRASATTTATPRGGTCSSSAGSSSPTRRPRSLRTASSPTRTRAPAGCTRAPRCSTPPPPSPLPCACG